MDRSRNRCENCIDEANCMDCPYSVTASLRMGEQMRRDDREAESRARLEDYGYGCTWDSFTGILYGPRDGEG